MKKRYKKPKSIDQFANLFKNAYSQQKKEFSMLTQQDIEKTHKQGDI